MKFKRREITYVQAYRLECDKPIETKMARVIAKRGQWVVRKPDGVHVCQNEIFMQVYEHVEGETYWKFGTVIDAYRSNRGSGSGKWFFRTKYTEESYRHDAFVKMFEPADDLARFYMEMTDLPG